MHAQWRVSRHSFYLFTFSVAGGDKGVFFARERGGPFYLVCRHTPELLCRIHAQCRSISGNALLSLMASSIRSLLANSIAPAKSFGNVLIQRHSGSGWLTWQCTARRIAKA